MGVHFEYYAYEFLRNSYIVFAFFIEFITKLVLLLSIYKYQRYITKLKDSTY